MYSLRAISLVWILKAYPSPWVIQCPNSLCRRTIAVLYKLCLWGDERMNDFTKGICSKVDAITQLYGLTWFNGISTIVFY